MATWGDFRAAAPEMAEAGRRLFYRTETGEALLATVEDGEPPRIHPIWIGIVDDRLYAFIGQSAKRASLERDGRHALHCHVDPVVPGEFSVRGRATLVAAGPVRDAIEKRWYFEPGTTYDLFEFSIDSAVLGVRDNADEWPPRYSTWRAAR
jgi:Pyridoxamine 5'-phosphate oxidase